MKELSLAVEVVVVIHVAAAIVVVEKVEAIR